MANVYHNLASRTSNEIGLGYYTLTHKKWMCEFYNLYNNTKLYYLNETGSSTGQADRMDCAYEGGSTQFDIGYIRPGENLFLHSVAFGVKYSHVKYSLFEFDEGYGTNFNPQYTLHLGNPNYDFLAISNTTRFRFPNLCTILVQPSYHLNLNHGNREKQLSPFYSDFWLTLGFEIRYVLPRNRPVED